MLRAGAAAGRGCAAAACAPRRTRGAGGRKLQLDGERGAGELLAELLDAAQVALAHPLQHEAVGRDERPAAFAGFGPQGLDPGVELLLGQLLFKARQAEGPEILSHGVGLGAWSVVGQDGG